MMNKVQNSAISLVIRRIFFLSLLIVILSVASCTEVAGGPEPFAKGIDNAKQAQSLQEQLRNSPDFKPLPLHQPVDSLVVYKSRRLMYAWFKGKKLKAYVISLGQAPVGKKQCKGDNKTPQGLYYISDRNTSSAYHKNLGVSYPDENDRANARRQGLSTGGDIKIHGLPLKPQYPREAYLYSDWTWGCIAVSDAEIDELFVYVAPRAALLILP